jgi:thiamine-monophosphate kinase
MTTEDTLINTLAQHLPDASVLSDDAFVAPDGRVYTTDMLVEGQHFDLSTTTPQQLGHKLGAVNLSDLAAMGASPLYLLVSVGLPKTWPLAQQTSFVDQCYQGLSSLLKQYGGQIVGGDTVGTTHGVTLNVTAIGQILTGHTAGRRSGAQVGDWLYTTGCGGLSAVGWQALQTLGVAQAMTTYPNACKAHLTPTPQLATGLWLAKTYPRYGLMDTSDGLADAALKIASASRKQTDDEGLQLMIEASTLMQHPELRHYACTYSTPPLPLLLYGGEDFELLASLPPPKSPAMAQALTDAGLVCIGKVCASNGPLAVLVNDEGDVIETLDSARTFQHF